QRAVEVQSPDRERRPPVPHGIRTHTDLGASGPYQWVHSLRGVARRWVDRDGSASRVIAVETEPAAQIELGVFRRGEHERRLRARDRRAAPAGVLGPVAGDVERERVTANA